jgi:hypothetical protein
MRPRHPAGRSRLFPQVTLVVLALAAGAGSAETADRPFGPVRPGAGTWERFLARHWARPIPPQGEAPAGWSPVERSLAPVACGSCHPTQYADWKESLHARAFGPGIAGQLAEAARREPAMGRRCGYCHAPLAEQSPEAGVAFDLTLRDQGLVCAGCHVRGHRRFGPPRRDGSVAATAGPVAPPHGGVTREPAFLRSEFCASCHQFPPGGLALNGKLLENTYEEWRRSPAARRGRQCQDCHMPDRRHRWRGIHDPEMVRGAVAVRLAVRRGRDGVGARLVLESREIGHHFPTYVTPRVVARLELTGPDGATVPGSVEERVIGREVTLDLAREIADTRLPAGGRLVFDYRRPWRPGARLRSTVTVYPDHFYTAFFTALLAQGPEAGEAEIRGALAATRRSPFVLDMREIPLD